MYRVCTFIIIWILFVSYYDQSAKLHGTSQSTGWVCSPGKGKGLVCHVDKGWPQQWRFRLQLREPCEAPSQTYQGLKIRHGRIKLVQQIIHAVQFIRVYMQTFRHWWCAPTGNANAITLAYTLSHPPSRSQRCHCNAPASSMTPDDDDPYW